MFCFVWKVMPQKLEFQPLESSTLSQASGT